MQVANIIGTRMGPSRFSIGNPVVMPIHELDNAPLNGARVAATPEVCNQIICGFLSQGQAGADLLYACAEAGHVGTRPGCQDAMCRSISGGLCDGPVITEPRQRYVQPPTANSLPFSFPEPVQVVDPRALTPPMPSITPVRAPLTAAPGTSTTDLLGMCAFNQWVDRNKGLAAVLVVAGFMAMRNKR